MVVKDQCSESWFIHETIQGGQEGYCILGKRYFTRGGKLRQKMFDLDIGNVLKILVNWGK